MNKSAKAFLSDSRNIGGRTQILQLMHNHKCCLKQIKPIVKIDAPHPHVDSKKPPHNYLQGNFI